MEINETIVTGRKFRKCIDEANKLWQRISFWHKASDCEFDDGKTAEEKVGAIDGITDSLTDTSSRVAASAKAVSTLNQAVGTIRTAVLEAGATSLTFPGISSESMIDIYTDIFGVNPESATFNNDNLVLTFKAQSTDINVKVRII